MVVMFTSSSQRLCCFGALALATTVDVVSSQSISAVQPEGWSEWASVPVSWEHPSPDVQNDWVAAFLVDWPATYISWHPLNESANWGDSSTSGTISINLLNGRHGYEFRYYRGNDVLATSNVVEPIASTPTQGHLSLVPGYNDRMTISWANNMSTGQIVYYGEDKDNLDSTVTVSTDTYTNLDFTTCMGIAAIDPVTEPFANLSHHEIRCSSCYDDPTSSQLFLDPGYLHSSVMQPLTSGQRYYYQFGNEDGLMSDVFSFVAPRVAGDMTDFTFIVTADAGIGAIPQEEQGSATHNDPPANGADDVTHAMINDPMTANDELLILNGDISYARGWAWIWERYMDLISPISTQLPWMVTVGNHEVDTHENPLTVADGGDSGGECGVTTIKRFPYFPSLDVMWYSFDYGSVHFVMLSSEHPTDLQVPFFINDVANMDRKKTPWLIVALHRPLFCSDTEYENEIILRETWHELFVNNTVDVVLTGHEHYYERLCAVQDNVTCATDRDRPIYIVDGSAGAEFGPTTPTNPDPLTVYKEFNKWGYSRISIKQSDGLTWTHYHTDNEVVDEVTLPPLKW